MKICPNCRYQRKASDEAPSWQCPSCGGAYIKSEPTRPGAVDNRVRVQQNSTPPVRASSGSNRGPIVVGCILLALAGFGVWKYKHRTHVGAEQASAEGFDAARKAFEEDHYAQAMRGFAPLADSGNAKAQYYVGHMYGNGWSDNPFDSSSPQHKADRAKQIEWLTKSAEQGEIRSQLELADLYGRGFGPNADRTPAAHWQQMAADQGDAKAQYWVGHSYETGNGAAKDYSQALTWYRKSAAQEYDLGLRALGAMYASGLGVTKSNVTAYEFFALAEAANQRNPNDRSGFSNGEDKALAAELAPREREEADQFVAGWKKGQSLPQ